MNDKVISIIVPVYNAEQFISQTIESILTQSYTHFELILVNDGSTDGSENIINQWINKDDRIVYINQLNQGPSATRNTGLDHAKGDLVVFIDADDELKSDGLEQMVDSMHQSDLLIFGYENHFDKDGKKNRVVTPTLEGDYSLQAFLPAFGQLFKDNLIHYVWNKVYKRDIVGKIRFDESVKVGEDLLFNLDVMHLVKAISLNNQVLYSHNWYNGDSITTKFHRDLFAYRIRQFEETRHFLKNNQVYSDINRQIIDNQFFKKYLAALVNNESADSDLTSKEKKKLIRVVTSAADKQELLSYSNRTYWEKLVVFQMKYKMVYPLYTTIKVLKRLQDKRRQH